MNTKILRKEFESRMAQLPSQGKDHEFRQKAMDAFYDSGFPSRQWETWKYTDLKTILSNNLNKLEIPNNKKTFQYNSEWLLKNFQHNQIILINGNFVSSNFGFEDKEKIKIKPLKMVLNDEKDFEKIREYFTDQQNSLISLNHALVNDGIFLEIKDNYSFNKPLIIYNFFNKSSENKIINNKSFISLGKNSKLSLLECHKAEDGIKYFNNAIHNYSIQKNAILKKFNIDNNLDRLKYNHVYHVTLYQYTHRY